jgi:hypothetical protein
MVRNPYRKLVLLFLVIVAGFVLGNYLIWKNVTEVFLTGKFDGGDLSRMGYILDSKLYRKNNDDLPRRHMELEEFHYDRPVDMVVLGDSFANFGGGGHNRYYQDYIATANDFTVLNVRPFTYLGFPETLAALCNNGFFDRVKPRYVLLSSSEKLCLERYAVPADLTRNIPMAELAGYRRNYYEYFQPNVRFINSANLNYLKYRFLYHFSPNAFSSNTYQMQLARPFFTVKNADTLLFYENDLKSIKFVTPATMKALNANLNAMADMLARKGIRFYFMPCVDKYNLYSDYIVNNRFPRSRFFEELRPLPKRYTLIDSKAILLPELARGEKDLFYPDDSHWSWKASEKIFETVRFNGHRTDK